MYVRWFMFDVSTCDDVWCMMYVWRMMTYDDVWCMLMHDDGVCIVDG